MLAAAVVGVGEAVVAAATASAVLPPSSTIRNGAFVPSMAKSREIENVGFLDVGAVVVVFVFRLSFEMPRLVILTLTWLPICWKIEEEKYFGFKVVLMNGFILFAAVVVVAVVVVGL